MKPYRNVVKKKVNPSFYFKILNPERKKRLLIAVEEETEEERPGNGRMSSIVNCLPL